MTYQPSRPSQVRARQRQARRDTLANIITATATVIAFTTAYALVYIMLIATGYPS